MNGSVIRPTHWVTSILNIGKKMKNLSLFCLYRLLERKPGDIYRLMHSSDNFIGLTSPTLIEHTHRIKLFPFVYKLWSWSTIRSLVLYVLSNYKYFVYLWWSGKHQITDYHRWFLFTFIIRIRFLSHSY